MRKVSTHGPQTIFQKLPFSESPFSETLHENFAESFGMQKGGHNHSFLGMFHKRVILKKIKKERKKKVIISKG